MPANFTQTHIRGNAIAEPSVDETPQGTKVAELGIAVNVTTYRANGENEERTEYFDVTFFGGDAKYIEQSNVKPGDIVIVDAERRTSEWTDDSGNSRRSYDYRYNGGQKVVLSSDNSTPGTAADRLDREDAKSEPRGRSNAGGDENFEADDELPF